MCGKWGEYTGKSDFVSILADALLEFRKKGLEEIARKANEIADSYGAVLPGASQAISNRRDEYSAERALRAFAQAIRREE